MQVPEKASESVEWRVTDNKPAGLNLRGFRSCKRAPPTATELTCHSILNYLAKVSGSDCPKG